LFLRTPFVFAFIRVHPCHPVRQAKSGRSCKLKGACRVNYLFAT
jgi:hypothetical protein